MKERDIVTVFGEFLKTENLVKAEWIEIKTNYWWKIFLVPLSLSIVGYYLTKEKIWEDLRAWEKILKNKHQLLIVLK